MCSWQYVAVINIKWVSDTGLAVNCLTYVSALFKTVTSIKNGKIEFQIRPEEVELSIQKLTEGVVDSIAMVSRLIFVPAWKAIIMPTLPRVYSGVRPGAPKGLFHVLVLKRDLVPGLGLGS